MNSTVYIMLLIAGILSLFAYLKSPDLPLEGFRAGGKLFMGILPSMILAFIAAGMITIVLPREIMTKWMGEESGLRGILIATVAGSLTPG